MFEKLTDAPGTNAFPWINLYPISNAIAPSYSLDSDFRVGSAIQRLNNRALTIVFRLAVKTQLNLINFTMGLQHLP